MASIKDMKIGGPAKGPSKRPAKAENSTEKELQRLRRIDLLELLLDEIRQNEENATRMKEVTDLNERLNAKIDEQDAQIKHLQDELAQKEADIARLQANNEVIAHANGMLDVEEILKVQRLAVEMYIQRIPELAAEAKRGGHASGPKAAHAATSRTRAGE